MNELVDQMKVYLIKIIYISLYFLNKTTYGGIPGSIGVPMPPGIPMPGSLNFYIFL